MIFGKNDSLIAFMGRCFGSERMFFSRFSVINLCRHTAVSTSVMSSRWWEQWIGSTKNGTSVSTIGCFNATQSTVLNAANFGGVPYVLLLNFFVFLVCVCQSACGEFGYVVFPVISVSFCIALLGKTESLPYCFKNYTRMFFPL